TDCTKVASAMSTTDQTIAALKPYIRRTPLSEKLLSKPPFRYLHDLVSEFMAATGFGQGLYAGAELDAAAVKDKDAKLAWLTKIIQLTALAAGTSVAAKPAKIVAGLDADDTNAWLRLMAGAAHVDTSGLVAQCGGTAPPSAAPPAPAAAPAPAPEAATSPPPAGPEPAHDSEPAPAAEPARSSSKPSKSKSPDTTKPSKARSPSKTDLTKASSSSRSSRDKDKDKDKDKAKDRDKDQDKDKDRKRSSKDKDKESVSPTKKDSSAVASKSSKGSTSNLDSTSALRKGSAVPSKTSSGSREKLSSKSSTSSSSKKPSTAASPPATAKSAAPPAPADAPPVLMAAPAPSATPPQEPEPAPQPEPLQTNSESAAPQELSAPAPSAPAPAPELVAPARFPSTSTLSPPTDTDDNPAESLPDAEPTTAAHDLVRPVPVRRRERPTTARKAPPRARNPNDDADDEGLGSARGARDAAGVAVVPDAPAVGAAGGDAARDGDVDDMFVVAGAEDELGSPDTVGAGGAVPPGLDAGPGAADGGAAGGLVRKLLESKREFMDQQRAPSAAPGVVRPASARTTSPPSGTGPSRDVDALRDRLQRLTRAAFPLGKTLDYVQEDLDAMAAELAFWNDEARVWQARVDAEVAQTQAATAPLDAELKGVEASVVLEVERLAQAKARVLANEEAVARLVAGMVAGAGAAV
ncbi:TRAF3-interacting protein 1, partial [Allomyces arbusculus]